ncbi:hypothetical protein CEP54_008926 [Fusarium duplospermum]|uniref:Uncharacterized protein n=1 Tax=Fusarium duplospermum TaxID=1325734 RepID=A0A428PTR4_9HYPO|nr:hypothetical protein CEP54_008926 [Fusarium duplospermum]
MRLRLAQSLDIPLESLNFSPETGLLIWEGMNNEIVEAVEKGTIPMVLKQAQPNPSSHSVIQQQGIAFELILVATGTIDSRVTTAQDLGVAWQKGPLSDGFLQSLPSLRDDVDILARLIDIPRGAWDIFGQKFASFMESRVFKQQESLLEILDRILDELDPVA